MLEGRPTSSAMFWIWPRKPWAYAEQSRVQTSRLSLERNAWRFSTFSRSAATVYVFASAMSHRELIKKFFTLQEERVKAYKTFDRLVINLDYRPTHLSEVYPTQNVSKMENITSHNLRKIRVLKYLWIRNYLFVKHSRKLRSNWLHHHPGDDG